MHFKTLFSGFFIALSAVTLTVSAQDTLLKKEDRVNLHFQTTYVYQYSARFHSPYAGANSLSGNEEKQNSLTATLFAGVRLWKGAAFYVNPEVAGGSGLSGALGMGGSSNGETFRVGDPSPSLYLGRAYLSQTFALSAKQEQDEDGANSLNTFMPEDHLRFVIGKYSLGDLFDNNACANSPRTQFLNWCLMNNGAWDYAANVRGYTLAAGAELAWHSMKYKVAVAALPKEANGADLETDPGRAISVNAEVDRQYHLKGREGNIRLLGYYNRTHMGTYRDAISLPVKDIVLTERPGGSKTGFGLSMDQEIKKDLSLFLRLGWNDGRQETWCFTEVDHTASFGALMNGSSWKRENDQAGAAVVVNGLSKDHHEYLAAGGYGFILGDGALNYAPEEIGEVFYSTKVLKSGLWLTGDYQLCLNPGYNKDRGPANILSLRVHVEL